MTYFIGFNKRTDSLFDGLFDLGANLMFYYHPATIALNKKYNFYNGEWMFFDDKTEDGSGIRKIREFLDSFNDLKYEIIITRDWITELL